MAHEEEVARIAALAAAHAEPPERVTGVVAAEATGGQLVFLCSFESDASSGRAWLAFDRAGCAITNRGAVREAASLAALCEVAIDAAAGGDLDELRRRLSELRVVEAPDGIEEAEAAAAALAETIGTGPRVASAAYLDAVGAAARRLESALGDPAHSPFAAAMQASAGAVEALATDVIENYKLPLD